MRYFSTPLNFGEKSTFRPKSIMTLIHIIHDTLYPIKWQKLTEGGFGVIEVAEVKYKNLSSSYTEPRNGYPMNFTQNLVKKVDKNFDEKTSKILRERKIIKRL
jgi:hypothetical protein